MEFNDLNDTFKDLKLNIANSKNEEEVRLSWVRALEKILNVSLYAERDKKDISYNNVVIEFKGPNKFTGKKNNQAFKEAMEKRLLPYIKQTALKEKLDQSDYIGIAIDSAYICFAQVVMIPYIHEKFFL